jgi:hypothetical protein
MEIRSESTRVALELGLLYETLKLIKIQPKENDTEKPPIYYSQKRV